MFHRLFADSESAPANVADIAPRWGVPLGGAVAAQQGVDALAMERVATDDVAKRLLPNKDVWARLFGDEPAMPPRVFANPERGINFQAADFLRRAGNNVDLNAVARPDIAAPLPEVAPPLRDTGTPLEYNPRKPWEALKLRRSDQAQEQIRTTLRSGRITHSPNKASVSGGVNGALDTVNIVNRHTGAHTKAVLKPISGGGAQELFGYEVARAMKIEHLVPAVGRRSDGTAAMEFRSGKLFSQTGIHDSRSLEDAFQKSHAIRDPEAAEAVIARRAHVDRQLVQTFDYLIANGDRHGNNALFDSKRGIVSLIDNGLMDRYDPKSGAPQVRMDFQGGVTAEIGADFVTTMKLDEEVVSILQHTDRTHLKRAFGQMLRDQSGAKSVGSYARASKPEFLEQIMGRLDDALKHGSIRVRGAGWW
ncbi:MAG: hypothetical protein JWM90_247 [Thermoleophilia bacterium]|nr:hypothetical protein [Thermoleophilia bacterium]